MLPILFSSSLWSFLITWTSFAIIFDVRKETDLFYLSLVVNQHPIEVHLILCPFLVLKKLINGLKKVKTSFGIWMWRFLEVLEGRSLYSSFDVILYSISLTNISLYIVLNTMCRFSLCRCLRAFSFFSFLCPLVTEVEGGILWFHFVYRLLGVHSSSFFYSSLTWS